MQRSTKVRVTASLVAISAVENRTVWSFASGLPNAVRSLTYLMVSSSTFSAPGDGADGDREPLAGQVLHQVDEALALLAEEVPGGDADVGERQLRGVLGGHADLLEVAATLEARGVALDDDEAEAVGAGVRVGLADDDHQVAHDAVGDERLLTVDDPLVALADGAGLDALQVRAGAGLGHRDGGDHLAGAEARQPALLLLVVRQLVQVRRDDVVVQREAEPARARAGDLLGDDPLEAQVGRARRRRTPRGCPWRAGRSSRRPARCPG